MKLKMNSDALEIYRRICNKIISKIKFDESKKFIQNFYPTNNVEEIVRRQNYLKEMFKKVKDVNIGKIKPIEFKVRKFNDRLLVVDEEEYEEAKKAFDEFVAKLRKEIEEEMKKEMGEVVAKSEIPPSEPSEEKIDIEEIFKKAEETDDLELLLHEEGIEL